jgi:hypothetical protein
VVFCKGCCIYQNYYFISSFDFKGFIIFADSEDMIAATKGVKP